MSASSAAPGPRRVRSAQRQFCATMLWLEVFLVLFAVLVAFGLRLVDPAVLAIGGAALALSLAVSAGMLGRPGGYAVGSVLQAPLPLAGLWLGMPVLVALGVVFAALWVVALRLGARIDRERAEQAEPDQPGAGDPSTEG